MKHLISILVLLTFLPFASGIIWIQPSRFTTGGAPSALLTGLVSYWNLNETSGTRADSHGSNDLTDNATVGNNTGKVSNAADFVSANSEFLSHASNSDLQTGDIDFTFALWFYRTGSGSQVILAKDVDGSREYTLDVTGGGALRWYYSGGGEVTFNEISSATSISTDTWYFVVVWHDAAGNTWNIQVNNGTADSIGTSGNAPPSASAVFEIGAREYVGAEGFFDGRVDEVGFWKRVLTTDEKTSLYNSGSGTTYPF